MLRKIAGPRPSVAACRSPRGAALQQRLCHVVPPTHERNDKRCHLWKSSSGCRLRACPRTGTWHRARIHIARARQQQLKALLVGSGDARMERVDTLAVGEAQVRDIILEAGHCSTPAGEESTSAAPQCRKDRAHWICAVDSRVRSGRRDLSCWAARRRRERACMEIGACGYAGSQCAEEQVVAADNDVVGCAAFLDLGQQTLRIAHAELSSSRRLDCKS